MEDYRTVIENEFRFKNFGLEHTKPHLFVTPQCGPVILYSFWTISWLLYHIVWVVLMIYWDAKDGNLPEDMWAVYLTNWSYTLINVAALWDHCAFHYVQLRRPDIKKGESKYMPWYIKLNWILFNTSNTIGFIVSCVFYKTILAVRLEQEAASLEKHGLATIFLFSNFFFCAKPVRFLHFYQPIVFLLVYGIFHISYQVTTGVTVYPGLHYNENPGPYVAFMAGLGLIGIPLVHLLFYGFYHLRMFVHLKRCASRRNDNFNTELTRY